MGHPQPLTPVATDNLAENTIVNGTAKSKISRAIYMIFYLCAIKSDKTTYTYFGRKVRNIWCTTSQNTTRVGTTELCGQEY